MTMKMSRRETMQLSATALAGMSFAAVKSLEAAAQGAPAQSTPAQPGGLVKWTGVRFSDFAKMVGAQNFASYGRMIATDGYYLDEDINTLMHPQVVLAWLLNDQPIPPQHGAPLRLLVPFRYGARSIKAITDIQFTATSFPPLKPWTT